MYYLSFLQATSYFFIPLQKRHSWFVSRNSEQLLAVLILNVEGSSTGEGRTNLKADPKNVVSTQVMFH